jgi:excisionase family DNA binding protein
MSSISSTPKISPKLISLRETARILKVHKETLRRWDQKGKLKAVRVGSRQDRKYLISDVIQLLEKRK